MKNNQLSLASSIEVNKQEQNILLKISNSIIGTLDFEEVLQIICDGMAEILEIETGAIYILENEKEVFLGATTPPLDPMMPDSLRRFNIDDHPHIKLTLTNRCSLVLQDTQKAKLSAAEKSVVELRKLRSLIYFPFIQKENVLGILILGTIEKERNFSQHELELGQTIANQLSIGIQNARLHHDLQQKNKKLITEIEERKKIENALRNSEAHLSNALRIAKLGHWEYDIKKDEFRFTDELFEIYRTTAEKEGGYTMSVENYAKKFVHPDDYYIVKKEIQKAIETKDFNFSAEVEHKIIYSDGEVGEIVVRYQVIKDKNGKTIKAIGANQDLTKQKQIEKELKEHRDNLASLVKEKTRKLDDAVEKLKSANDKLFEKNKIISNQNQELKLTLKNLKETQAKLIHSEKMASLGVLTAGIAHEINNPLNFIMGSYVGLESYFEDKTDSQQDDVKKLMKNIKTGLDRASGIVKGLNQFSRDNKTDNEDCSINTILENCLTMLSNRIKNNIEVKKSFKQKEITVSGNVGQLHQVFLNILMNAIQSIKHKGIITLSTERNNNQLIIEILDNGEGISSKNLPKITEPFFTTRKPGEGTGLGLSITYSIIKEHNGTIEFESKEGKGTKVIVTLPLNQRN